jgi:hypothetical protein
VVFLPRARPAGERQCETDKESYPALSHHELFGFWEPPEGVFILTPMSNKGVAGTSEEGG